MTSDQRPRIAWALGGGGARGFAHLGVLKVLQEENIPINALAGTSMGAVMSVLYAAGTDLKYLSSLATSISWEKFVDLRFPRYGLVQGKRITPLLRLLTKGKKLEELDIPVRVIATDLLTGEEVIFDQGDTELAVRASISIPGIFTPVLHEDKVFVDGGVVAGVPVAAAGEMGMDLVIGVSVASEFDAVPPKNLFEVLYRTVDIMTKRLDQIQTKEADLVITPDVGKVGTVHFQRAEECIEKGEIAAREALPKIRKLMAEFEQKSKEQVEFGA